MRNLLTDTFKRKLRQEYNLRLLAVAGMVFSIGLFAGILMLLPSYFLSQSRHAALEDQYALLQSSIAALSKDASKGSLVMLRERLEVLVADKEQKRLTESLIAVLDQKTDTVAFNTFVYDKSKGSAQLTLKGVAADREALLSLRKALEQTGRFEKVELPVSNLAPERDIAFTLTLSGSF